MNIESKVFELVKKPLLELGLVVDEVLYVKESNSWFLRIVIDKEPYIDIDDCVNATKAINALLDNEDFINDSYILDVCSKERGGNYNGR